MTPSSTDLAIKINEKEVTISNHPKMNGSTYGNKDYYGNDNIRTIKFPRNVKTSSDNSGSLYKVTKIEFVNYGYTNLKTISVPNGVEIIGDIEGFEIKYY